MSELLHYIENTKAENAVNPSIRRLHQIVTRVKHNEEVGVRYMKAWEYEMWIKEKAEKEGEEKGIKEGIKEGELLNIIRLTRKKKEKGLPVEKIAEEVEETVDKVNQILGAIAEYPDKTDDEIKDIVKMQFFQEENR